MAVPTTNGLVIRLETVNNGVQTSGNTVTEWQDESGNGNDLDVIVGDPRFGLVTTPTGVAAISLDGGSDGTEDSLRRLTNVDLPGGGSDRTFFMVTEYIDADDFGGFIYGNQDFNEAFGLAATRTRGGDPSVLAVAGFGPDFDQESKVTVQNSGWLVHSVVVDDDQVRVFRDGKEIDQFTQEYETVVSQIFLGEEFNQRNTLEMNVAAVLGYDRALTEAERTEVEAYLQETYIQDSAAAIAPVVNDDAASISSGGSVTLNLIADDFDDDLDIDASSVEIINQPLNGSVTVNGDGTVTYTHDGSGGPDFFTYRVSDNEGQTSGVASVDITVDGQAPFDQSGFGEEVIPIAQLQFGFDPNSFFQPLSMEFLPDNRILLLDKGGQILIVDPTSGRAEQYMTLQNIDSGSERGLLDITLDPDFANNGHFYLYYTPDVPERARISRFTHDENAGGLTSSAELTSEVVLWQDTDGYLSCCHYGGGLDFGPDGNLWLTSADKFDTTTPGEADENGSDSPLNLDSTSGKIIRIQPDGGIPADNPFANGGGDPSVFAYGLRNPFRARWDEEYGNFYIAEVGGNTPLASDELHVADLNSAGAFFGWVFYEGTGNDLVNTGKVALRNSLPQPDDDIADVANGDFFSTPIFEIERANGVSITGGEVYRGDLFPEEWDGVYFGGDFTRDELFALQLDATGTEVIRRIEFKPTEFLPGSSPNIVYLGVGQDDALYYINFDVAGGQVSRIFHGTPNEAPTITNANVSGAAGASQFTYSATFGDAEGDSIDWVINFGDGTSQSGTAQSGDTINVTKNFQSSGFFEASIEASDGTSTAFSNSLAATSGNPNNQPVVEAFTVDNPFPDPAEPIAFTIDGSDADGDPLTFELAFGDGATQQGSLPANGDPVVVNRTYDSDGSFLAQVTIFDDQGGQTLSAPIEINVGETTGPGVTDGLVLELESDIKIGLNGDIVVNWLDGSGAGNNLDGFGDPRLVPNATPGGRPAIVFDGDGDFLVREDTANSPISGLADGDGARSLFFVVDYGETNNVSSGVVYGNGAPNEAFGLTNSFAPTAEANFMVQGWGRGNDEISGVNGADAGWVVQSVVVEDNGDWTHYVDGVAIDSGNRSWNTNIERLIIGGEINDLGESELSVAAIFGYNRALSEGERQQVEGYLQDKYLQASSAGSPPTAANDGYTGPQDATLTIPVGTGLLANDTDPDTATLTVTQINGVNVTNGQTVALANGSLTINADGSFTFVPNGGFVGDQTFAYTVSDGALTDTATATLTFEQTSGGGDNTAPTATVDAYTQTTGGTLSVGAAQGLLANDNDVDNDTLTVTAINGQAVANGQTVNLDNGALTIRADGSFDYTPTGGFVGAEAFTYSIADGNGGTDTTAALIEVTTAAGSPPNASFDSYATVVGQALTTTAGNGLLANDSDPDNNPIVVTRIDNQAVTNGQTVQLDNGSLTINVNGSFTYTPNGGFQGAEAFSYTISDNLHGDDTSVALIDVVAQQAGGSPPVAANDAYQTMEDSLLSVSPALGLLANDFDADNDALTVTQINGQNITDGQQIDLGDGMLTIDTDGSFSFMPDAGFNGAETFAYTVSDGVDGISVGAVTIDVLDGGPPAGEVPVQNGLVAWLESDARVTLGVGDQVNGWLDKSGIGIDLAVLGSPTLVQDATPTGIDAIRLDGVDDALVRIGAQNLSPLPGGNQDRTVFIVADYIDQNGVFAGVAYGEGLPNEAFGVVSTGSELLAVQGWGGGNDIISGVSDGDNVGADEWLVQSAILDDGQITHFLNDAIIDTGSQTYATDITSATSQLIIGGEIAGRGFAEMEVAAVLIYDRALSASEHDAVEQYLLEKFVTGSANAMGAEIELGNDVGGFDALSAVSNFGFNAESFVENEDLSGRTELIESMDENERLFRGVMSPEEAFIF